jgi:hypothetical protein
MSFYKDDYKYMYFLPQPTHKVISYSKIAPKINLISKINQVSETLNVVVYNSDVVGS